jgi:excisionase family DNA binding protein
MSRDYCHSDTSAARFLGVARRTIANLRQRGDLPYSKIGRRTVIRHSDLVALLERNRVRVGSADAA